MATEENADRGASNKTLITSASHTHDNQSLLFDMAQDLEQYERIASHHLQEPLRKIETYASLLRNSKSVSDADIEMITKIQLASTRMRLLLADLVDHVGSAKSGKMHRPVKLDHVVAKILEDFELAILEKKVVVNIKPLPTVDAAALDMYQLFFHLIDNAVKFSDTAAIPRITIQSSVLDDKAVLEYFPDAEKGRTYHDISIADNGIGFDTGYSDQIYKVFNRLHPKDEYSGSGIGLALCRKVLQRHSGKLLAISQRGQGATFHIIIPEKQL